MTDNPLTQLANRLKGIHFPDETGFFDQTFFDRCAANGSRACYPITSGAWVVKFSLGGKQTILGYSDSGADAARFADMARVRFHKYKLRASWKPLTDHDLNFDLNQVKEDETAVPEAVALLDDIEHLLLAEGVIKHYKEVEADRAALLAKKVAAKEVAKVVKVAKGDAVLAGIQGLTDRLDHIEKTCSATEKLLAQFVALSKT